MSASRSGVKITCIIYNLVAGGAERNILQLADWLANQCGQDVSLITLDPHSADFFTIPEQVRRVRASDNSVADCRWFDLPGQRRRVAAVRQLILETGPDLVISFLDTTNILTLMALAGTGVPVVVSERSDPRFNRPKLRWRLLRDHYYPQASGVVMLARDCVDWARNRWRKAEVQSIANPVLAPVISAEAEAVGLPKPCLISMGRLVQAKGFDLLLESFARLQAEFPDWSLCLLGDGPERDRLERLVAERGLKERVQFLGMVENPADFLSRADLYACSSRYEGFGMALAEAMACGLPVVSFDCPSGPRQFVRDGIDGLLIPNGDVAAMTQTLGNLMRDLDLRQRLASRAPEILDRYGLPAVMKQWEQLIQSVLEEQTR